MTSDPRPMPNPLPGAPEWSVKSLPRTRSHLPALVLSLFIHHAPRVQLKVWLIALYITCILCLRYMILVTRHRPLIPGEIRLGFWTELQN